MENCLVTKLKGTVENDNLNFLGSVVTGLNSIGNDVSITLEANSSDTLKVTVIGDGTLKTIDKTIDYGKSRENNGSMYVKFDGGGKLKIDNKYKIKTLDISSNENKLLIDLSCLAYMESLSTIALNNTAFGDVSEIKGINSLNSLIITRNPQAKGDITQLVNSCSNLSNISIFNTDITIDVNNITDSISTQLTQFVFSGTPMVGTIESFGKFINVEQMSFADVQVTGSVESFVQKQREKGRTAFANPNNKNWYFNSIITFNGVVIGGGAKNDFSWTENTITLGGVTINA
jgi:hypothetical protein